MQVSWRFEETCDWEVFGMEGLICVFEVGGCLFYPAFPSPGCWPSCSKEEGGQQLGLIGT